MLSQAARDFLMLLVTIDPVGALALFVPLTSDATLPERRRIARRAVIVAGAVLVVLYLVLRRRSSRLKPSG